MSFLSWLDYSESERRKMLDVISLFQQKESRDELGLGTIRDAFADIFFPGTSTIQTRARYFMFIPWIYQKLERSNNDADSIERKARKFECDLIEKLIASGEDEGVIGRRAGRGLQRLPSNIYWSGMQRWRVLLFAGSQTQCHKWFYKKERNEISFKELIEDPESDLLGLSKRTWNLAIPLPQPEFPDKVDFKLKKDEALFLKEQILSHCRGSLLAYLVLNGRLCGVDIDFVWMHPQYNEFPRNIQERLEHARNFSEIMHGAAWLYNLMLAEQVEQEKKISANDDINNHAKNYRQEVRKWFQEIKSSKSRFLSWDKKRFWEIIAEQNTHIPNKTKSFCMQWIKYIDCIENGFDEFINNVDIRAMIKDREKALKRENARLSNRRALENWKGESGIGQLDFRWHIARTMINDILDGINQG